MNAVREFFEHADGTGPARVRRARAGARWRARRGIVLALCAAALGGCGLAPNKPLVQQPMTALPPARPASLPPDGAIYSASYGNHPLFEDVRPRNIGDILTIVINENINATKSSGANTSRTGNADFTPTTTPGLLMGLFGHDTTSMSGDNAFKASGGANAQNTFTGTLTVTVTNVLANGNLEVSGEKQMLINQGNEFVRFSGIVNPTSIVDSEVPSTEVADAKIEYSAKGPANEAENMGWLQRLFLNIAPF